MKCRFCLFEITTESALNLSDDDEEEDDPAASRRMKKLISEYTNLEKYLDKENLFKKICRKCCGEFDKFFEFCEYIVNRQKDYSCLAEIKMEEEEAMDFLGGANIHKSNTISAQHQLLLDNNNIEILLDIKDVLITNDDAPEIENINDHISGEEPPHQFLKDSLCSIETNDSNNDSSDCDDNIPLLNFVSEKNLSKIETNLRVKKRKCTKKVTRKINEVRRKCSKSKEDAAAREGNEDKESLQADAKKENNNHEETEAFISQHLRLKCEMCEAPMETFVKLKKHFTSAHNTRGFVVCCGRRFYRRFVLTDHIQLHLNPDAFKCHECGKILKSKSCLDIHRKNKHVNKSQLRFTCGICDRRFAHSTNLRAHTLTHTTKKEFVCDTCQKAFKTNYSLQVHIKAIHKDIKAFVCDICGREFKFKPSFARHIAEHLGNYKAEPTEQCTICGKWLMKNGLKKHMDTHNKTEVECPECGKRLCSKSALNSHIKYIHVDKPLHKCTFCDKMFKQRTNLKEHMAIHTGTKDHKCAHCMREFRSKANMYVHIKRNHVKEWMEAQIQRTKVPTTDQSSTEMKEVAF